LTPPRWQRGSGHRGFVGLCAAVAWTLIAAAPLSAQEARRLNDAAARLTAEGRYAEALPLLARAHSLSPTDTVIRTNLATLRTVLGHHAMAGGAMEAAREHYQAALDLVPDEIAALLGLGDVALRLREAGAAVEIYRRALAVQPGEPDTYLRLGEAEYQRADLPAAVAAWEQGLRLWPEHAGLRRRLERARTEGQVEGAYQARLSQHFQLRFEGGGNEPIGREVLESLEAAYRDIGYWLGFYPPSVIQVTLYSQQDFQAVTRTPDWTGATYSNIDGRIRVAIRGATAGDPELRQFLYHEYAHAVIYGLTRGNIPTWLNEGLAVKAEWTGGTGGGRQESLLAGVRAAARQGVLIPLARLNDSFLGMSSTRTAALAYAQGYAAAEFLSSRYGSGLIARLLRRLGEGLPFPAAVAETFGSSIEQIEAAWHDWLQRGP
jgi:tetratricopeptide (TPR) repeat protein